MVKRQVSFRLSEETHAKIDKMQEMLQAKHQQSMSEFKTIPASKISKADVVDLAVSELHIKMMEED